VFAQDPAGIPKSNFDKSVRVQDDLFMHVNGTWMKETEIPSDKSNYGSFIVLMDKSQERIRDLIEQAAESENEPGSNAHKVGAMYKSFMDTERIESLGAKPLEPLLSSIRKVNDKRELVRLFGTLQQLGIQTPVGFGVSPDQKNSTEYLAAIIQSGTTLPDRDYYLNKDDEKFTAARDALLKHITTLLELSGHQEPQEAAQKILEIETELAQAHWERTKLRDAELRYNKHSIEQLIALTPKFNWELFLDAAKASGIENINVMTPSYFESFQETFENTPLNDWKDYLQYKVLDTAAPFLSQPFVDSHFELHDKVVAGIPEQQPRWKRAVDSISGAGAGDFGVLGDAVGQMYVEKYFKADAKERMDELVGNLLKAYKTSIDDLTWMTDETKKRAQEKLAKITTKIGYPDKWRDYSDLTIADDDLVGNMISSAKHEYDRMINKLGKPVDRTEWGMTPQTVNAYYNPSMNEIVFPAAILQAPFFDANVDDAANYGGIGAVIGHEISHAFDDQGSKYDGEGNLNNWWTDKDRAAFKALTDRLVNQYESYSPLDGKNVNGRLTLGENIADLSGLSIALKAYHLALGDQEAPVIAGWSGDQRFFLGWSQIWRRKYRDAEMVRRLLVDPHSPSHYRANGPVTNIDAFYEAFELKPGDKLFKPSEERIRIW
jgi:putative endopeptidase